MPTPNLTSPNIGNYYVGRGYLSMKLQGESVFTDMGNCTNFIYDDHYCSYTMNFAINPRYYLAVLR